MAEHFVPAQQAAQGAALLALGTYLKCHDYHFITPTPLTHQRNLDRLAGPAIDMRGAFGWNRSFAADLLPTELFTQLRDAEVLVADTSGLWRSTVRCSSLGRELLLHSGYPTDAADAVFFGPDTYRFATAIRAHLAQRRTPPAMAVDIGCGSGAGALVIATTCPGTQVWGTDINAKALALTAINAQLAGAPGLTPRASDVLKSLSGEFDLIVANPPYMQDPKGRAYRDGGSGLGSSLSLRILQEALGRLAPGGTCLLYTGVAIVGGQDPFLAAARLGLEAFDGQWRYQELDPDVFGEDLELPGYAEAERIAVVLMEATRSA